MRYQRQIQLRGFGQAAQDKLRAAKVLVVGAGGLGCPALQYLAAAGLGCIGICDFDRVEESNLHRQILFSMDDLGKPKAVAAAAHLQKMNPDLVLRVFDCQLDQKNAWEMVADFDLVLDASDNFATRYLLNDLCVLLDKPLIYGAVSQFEGQVAVFNFGQPPRSHYRDLLPTPPSVGSVLNCNENGVLGVLTGIIGNMQAAEAIKIITGIGQVLANRLLHYNMLDHSFYDFFINKNSQHSTMPKDKSEFLRFDYRYFCGDAPSPNQPFRDWLTAGDCWLIDVREKDEMPIDIGFPYTKIPSSIFNNNLPQPQPKQKILIFCQSGKRSHRAAELLKKQYPDCEVFSCGLQEIM